MSEDNIFRNAMGDVTPIAKAADNVFHPKKGLNADIAMLRRNAATKNQSSIDEALSLDAVELVAPDDLLQYKKPGVQDGVYRNLRLGKYELHSVLNIHGLKANEARIVLYEFIQDCQKSNLRSILIQHGRGLKSQPQQVSLKSYINKWLRVFDCVLAFHSAQPQHGGYGSVYVLLKKSEEARLMNKERHQKRNAS